LPFAVSQIRDISQHQSATASGQKSTAKSADLLCFFEFSNTLLGSRRDSKRRILGKARPADRTRTLHNKKKSQWLLARIKSVQPAGSEH
jgi:hypothetical protein